MACFYSATLAWNPTGVDNTPWKYPNSDERLSGNLEMFTMARDIAALHGRTPATANEYRAMLGLAAR